MTFMSLPNGRHPVPAQRLPESDAKLERYCHMRRRSARHHRDDAARVFVTFGLLPLPIQELVKRH
jgi:hypothetical protein